MFGEECEKGLRLKFSGHWYTDQPMKGSAFRMITITNFGLVFKYQIGRIMTRFVCTDER